MTGHGTECREAGAGDAPRAVRIAIIGDVHGQFTGADVAYFHQAAYDLLLLVGDVAGVRFGASLPVARRLAALPRPGLFIPGNHDAVTLGQLLAEIRHYERLARWTGRGQARRVQRLQAALGDLVMGGYSVHSYQVQGVAFDVIAARPFSLGGSWLGCRPYLRARYGVDSLAASADLLCRRVDEAPAGTLIFLAHNGPAGLGSARSAIWGCDFRPEGGDFGDPDLQQAVAYAQAQGKRVVAVVAGHMHHALHGGGQRPWQLTQDGVCYVNAACVPRIQQRDGRTVHHHVCLTFDERGAAVTAQWVPGDERPDQP